MTFDEARLSLQLLAEERIGTQIAAIEAAEEKAAADLKRQLG